MGNLKLNSRDPRCDLVMEETKDMDEVAANRHFCKMAAVLLGVFKDERPGIDGFPGGPQSTKSKCKEWMHQHGFGHEFEMAKKQVKHGFEHGMSLE